MKNLSIILLVLLVACKSKTPASLTGDSVIDADTAVAAEVVDNFPTDPISEAEYNTAPFEKLPDAYSAKIDDSTRVFADSVKIVFKLNNGADSALINNPEESFESYTQYEYVESCSYIDYWLVFISYYEGSEYLLMDKDDGSKIHIWGPPVFSPDKKYFVTNSSDIEAGFNYNGIQLFEVVGNKAVLKWQKEIDLWGPEEVRWKDNNTLYVKKYSINHSKSSSNEQYSYGSVKVSSVK